jgi:prepilin-type processing-associated H-X9-DG protein
MIGILLPAVGKAREAAMQTRSMLHMRQLSTAMVTYSMEYDDRLPPASDWIGAMEQQQDIDYDPLTWHPADDAEVRILAMNGQLDGKRFADIRNPSRTVLLFEVTPGSPMSGGPELLAPQPRYRGRGYVVLFADGHVENVPPADLAQLQWDP